jgi:hypothetical protein
MLEVDINPRGTVAKIQNEEEYAKYQVCRLKNNRAAHSAE